MGVTESDMTEGTNAFFLLGLEAVDGARGSTPQPSRQGALCFEDTSPGSAANCSPSAVPGGSWLPVGRLTLSLPSPRATLPLVLAPGAGQVLRVAPRG